MVKATTAADLCAPAADPCQITRVIAVDPDSFIDLGPRELLVTSTGSLQVGTGAMTLQAGRLTIQTNGSLRASGSTTDPGGTISATADVMSIAGRIEASGAPGGNITLTSRGDLHLTGAIEAKSRSIDEDGGQITLAGTNLRIDAPVSATGGFQGFGGGIEITADGDLLIAAAVDASAGDGGSVMLAAGTPGGGGNLTVSAAGRVVADSIGQDGFGDEINLTAEGDGVQTGNIVINGLLSVTATAGGAGGSIDISAVGNILATGPSARVTVAGDRPAGEGGDVSISTVRGMLQWTASTRLDSGSRAGDLTIDVGGPVTLGGGIDATSTTIGGSIDITSSADVTVEGALRTDGGSQGVGGVITVEGCLLAINATGILSSLGPNGLNRLVGHDRTLVGGTIRATAGTGGNEIVFGGTDRRPVYFASKNVVPTAIEILDPALRPCGPASTPTPTPTVTPTPTPTPTPTNTPIPCVGDCSGNRVVAINELLLGVNIALGQASWTTCPVFDPNSSEAVEVSELITAVNNALQGCP